MLSCVCVCACVHLCGGGEAGQGGYPNAVGWVRYATPSLCLYMHTHTHTHAHTHKHNTLAPARKCTHPCEHMIALSCTYKHTPRRAKTYTGALVPKRHTAPGSIWPRMETPTQDTQAASSSTAPACGPRGPGASLACLLIAASLIVSSTPSSLQTFRGLTKGQEFTDFGYPKSFFLWDTRRMSLPTTQFYRGRSSHISHQLWFVQVNNQPLEIFGFFQVHWLSRERHPLGPAS